MKDRQFMTVLALVVAAGLVMGLVAFRMTGGGPASTATAATASAAVGNPNAPRPSAADQVADQPVEDAPPSTDTAGSQNSEPAPTRDDPPELRGPANGDPPGTAAAEPSQPAPAAASSDGTLQ